MSRRVLKSTFRKTGLLFGSLETPPRGGSSFPSLGPILGHYIGRIARAPVYAGFLPRFQRLLALASAGKLQVPVSSAGTHSKRKRGGAMLITVLCPGHWLTLAFPQRGTSRQRFGFPDTGHMVHPTQAHP